MPWSDWIGYVRELTLEYVQICATDATGEHLQQDLVLLRCSEGDLLERQARTRSLQTHGLHGLKVTR